jgi:hypothetical protein
VPGIGSQRSVLKTLLVGWTQAIPAAFRALKRWCRTRENNDKEGRSGRISQYRCEPITERAFVRPDPFLYSQEYLSGLGLAVTWDNPDFAIFDAGAAVASHELQPDVAYEVVVRVWNNSIDGPAIAMPVHLSYLEFGAGTISHDIATTSLDVGVKGSAACPAFARFTWRTPPTAGHYCLQARLDPVDDTNTANNLGQHNTDVVEAHSPAIFDFLLRNATTSAHAYEFLVDSYKLQELPDCRGRVVVRRGGPRFEFKNLEATERRDPNLVSRGSHPLPSGWRVDVTPSNPTLAPGVVVPISVVAEPPPDFVGKQTINIHAIYRIASGERVAGGVTVTVTKES